MMHWPHVQNLVIRPLLTRGLSEELSASPTSLMGALFYFLQMDDVTLHGLCTSHGQVKVFTRQEADGSLLVSYVNLDDAINAKAALDQYELNGVPITAEFIKDWTDTGASATTNESDSLGFMTPDGLWIPPDADGEPAYYGRADEWCEGYDEEAQPDERWNGETAFDPVTSTACEDPSSQEQ